MTLEEVAVEAAHAAAAILAVKKVSGVRNKGAVDLVTEVDLACEAAIREVLGRHTPDIPVLGEEGGGAVGATTRWVVDPLDGTTNFVHGFPFYNVSVGLEVDGVPTVGVVVDAVRHRTYRGTRGRGATVEGGPLRTSDVRTLDEALFSTGFPYDRRQKAAFYLRIVQRVLERGQGVRRAGAAALDLAILAEGHVDAYWEFGLRPWDTMAGFVLVTESGGRISPIPGYPLTDPVCAIVTNPWLHDEVVALIGEALKEGT